MTHLPRLLGQTNLVREAAKPRCAPHSDSALDPLASLALSRLLYLVETETILLTLGALCLEESLS